MPDTSPAVAVLMPDIKPGLLLSRVPLDRLTWPLGRPERLMHGKVSDLSTNDHLIGFPQNVSPLWPRIGVRARVSMIMAEPSAIHQAYQTRIQKYAERFHCILSYNEALLAQVPNGIFFPYGSTWVANWRELDLAKSAMCSLIASKKRSQEGHVLRHEIARWATSNQIDIDLMGYGYAPFVDKAEGLARYRYSVVIENVRERNCFTEKLIDSVLCQTVPIYWGCPNIDDFMDISGMMLCESEDDVRDALGQMSDADYRKRLPGLMSAIPQAAAYSDTLERAARAVLEDRPVPSLGV